MKKNIVVICENNDLKKLFEESGQRLCQDIKIEIQQNGIIKDELSIEDIKNCDAILFVTDKSLEEIESIERFIDCEYYEVEPNVAINDVDRVIKEIIEDINNN